MDNSSANSVTTTPILYTFILHGFIDFTGICLQVEC